MNLMKVRPDLAAALSALALMAGAFPIQAQLPLARLNWVFPTGMRAGTTNELTISGSSLDDPTGLRFSDTRIVATAKPDNAAVFTVIVPPEVPPGFVDVRFTGRFGVSNPRALAIGDTAELTAPTSNTSAATAFELPLDSVVDGRTAANTASWFRFAAKAAQRLVIRTQSRELDSRLEPMLVVLTTDGRELSRSRRGFLDFTAPAEGHFLLQLHDQTFRGGDDFSYRLTVTAGAQLEFALPNVLRAGETNFVTLYGHNLPGDERSPVTDAEGRPLDRLGVEVIAPALGGTPAELIRKPAAAMLAGEAFAWRLGSTNGSSNPLLFTLTTNPVFVSLTNGIVPVTPPCEFSGLFPKRGELNGVVFEAKKGDVLWVELWGERLGQACDPFALLQRVTKNDKGEAQYGDLQEFNDGDTNVGGRDFNTATRDPAGRIEIKEDGSYRILVRDLFNTGATSPRHPYRLSLRRETPDFRLVALPQPPPKAKDDDRQVHVASTFLRQGETLPVRVLALRRDGFSGDIEITATNLPAGVSVTPGHILAGQNAGQLLLTAAEGATGCTNVQFLGRAVIGAGEVSRLASLGTVIWPVGDYDQEAVATRLDRDASVAAGSAEWAPVTLQPAESKTYEATVDGKLTLPLNVTRRGDFNAAFNVKPFGNPTLDKAKDVSIAEKATNATVEINLAELKLPEGTHTLWVQGVVAGKYRNNPEALTAAEAELKELEKNLATAPAAEKPKLEERKKAVEAKRKAAEDRAKPADVTVAVYSQPFLVKVLPAPKPEVKK